MAEENEKHGPDRPCVHITYEVQIGDAVETRELPFVVGVLADLLGQPDAPPPRLADRRFFQIDRDNFDNVLRAFVPRLAFEVENTLAPCEAPMRVKAAAARTA
jgi:type VI secretion system protein ImpB